MKRVATVAMILAVVLVTLSFIPEKKALAGSFGQTVILLHGLNTSSAINCNAGSEFGTIESYFHNQNYWATRSLGFYNGDSYCDDYVSGETSHCTGWYDSGSSDGTVNEDIRHTSCLIAWYIWDHYTQYGTTISVIAHSMGGILIRQAMIDTPYEVQFPPYLQISDVATAATPHQGLDPGSAGILTWTHNCPGNCVEVSQMEDTNKLMTNMNSTSWRSGFGRDPQGSGGTDWTTMGGNYDTWLQAGNPESERMGAPAGGYYLAYSYELTALMPGATHFVFYPVNPPAYDHGGYLTDTNTTWNANEDYSDNNGGTWYSVNNSEHSIYTLYEAILLSSW